MSELFKLPDNYTWLQLRDSYKRLAIQNHPDKGGDPDFFNYITNEFQKLAINIKQREKDHFSLKVDLRTEKLASCRPHWRRSATDHGQRPIF